MSKPKLTEQDFQRAAERLQCDVPAIKAVAFVESRGDGFYSDGFPVILFERHIFRKLTQGRYNKSHPEISGPAGNYGKAGQHQRDKFNEAFGLNPDAAMKSCSWGKFQIMGFNHEACGFSTVGAFVDAMKESEGRQLDAFVSFVIHNKLNQYLRSHNWSKFARGYNGEGYEKNDYDNKMANAWLRYNSLAATASATHESPLVGKTSDSSTGNLTDKADAADSSATETKLTKESGDTKVEVTDKNEQDVNTPAKLTTPDPYLGIGFWAVIKRDMAAAGAGNLSFQGISEYAQQASGWPPWVIGLISKLAVLAVIFTVGWFVFRVIHYAIDTHKKNLQLKLTAEAATSTVRKDIQWQ